MLGWRKRAVVAAFGLLLLAGIWAVSRSIPRTTSNAPAIPDTLPSQLSDAEFWQLVEDFSEPDGYFRSDNFLSNEAGLQTVIPKVKEHVKPGGIYIGVGPEQNFTYVLSFEPKLSFVVDIRRLNMLEHLLYKGLFELSSSRADFVSRLFSRKRPQGLDDTSTVAEIFAGYKTIAPDRALFERGLAEVLEHLLQTHQFPLLRSDQDQIRYVYNAFFQDGPDLSYTFRDTYYQGTLGMPTYEELMLDTDGNQNWGFLATEERFRRLQDIQRRNLIVPLVGDFAGPKTLRAVGQYLRQHDAVLSIFYLSNVETYLFQKDDAWLRFYDNVSTMPTNSASTFIRFTASRGTAPHLNHVWSPIHEILAAVRARKIDDYASVIGMSH
jgi:hypothetical protein